MSEKLSEVYEEYNLEIFQTMRGRGATVLKTNNGIMQLKQLDVSEGRLNAENHFKKMLYETGFTNIDRPIENKNNELITYDRYNNPYVMRTFFEGKECNATDMEEINIAIDNLATLHMHCKEIFEKTESDVHIRMNKDFRKRNQELKRVRGFISRQRHKREFEEKYIKAYDYFYEQGLVCENKYTVAGIEEMKTHLGYCHGMYNHHSVLLCENNEKGIYAATINFDRFNVGNQLEDLYYFMRKIVEKNNYSFEVLELILDRYGKICSISEKDIEYIYILYSYPEKFYKISNQYINSPKNWISPKMIEKLDKVIKDEDKKLELLEKLKTKCL